MPHHHSWFDLLLGNFYRNMEAAGQVLRRPGSSEQVSVQHVFAALLVLAVLLVLGFLASRSVRSGSIVPEERLTVRTFLELIVEAVYKQMKEMMGAKAARFFLPLIGTCALFILFSNALGLVPGFTPPTDSMNTTLAMSGVVFFTTHIFGVKEHGLSYFKHFFGPIIKWYALPLMLLIFVVEVISHFVRPLSLALRLAANMAGDHMVLSVFLSLVPFLVPLPIYMLGTIVVIVQTLVFCLLSMVYISMAIAHEEH